jgi:Ca2+-binding RTX toxin-like protein
VKAWDSDDGGGGNDILSGGAGIDTLIGGAGGDRQLWADPPVIDTFEGGRSNFGGRQRNIKRTFPRLMYFVQN